MTKFLQKMKKSLIQLVLKTHFLEDSVYPIAILYPSLFIGIVIFTFSGVGVGVIFGMITCIKNLRSKSRMGGDENLAQSDLEIAGNLRKIDRKWAKALGIDLRPKRKN